MTRKPPLPGKPTILKSTRPNLNVGKHGRLFHASRKPVGFTDDPPGFVTEKDPKTFDPKKGPWKFENGADVLENSTTPNTATC